MRSGGPDAFKVAMAQPLEELAPVYREVPIYYITNRFTVVGPGATVAWPRYSKVMDYELEVGVVTRRARANIPAKEAGAHIFGYTIFNDFSGATGRRSRCKAVSGRPRARASTAPMRLGPGS
jgi:2-keto-4-pentenoate hydratase/2-oxohepta-3-ene-1,7-dioic acid hydratase in catechol pathway